MNTADPNKGNPAFIPDPAPDPETVLDLDDILLHQGQRIVRSEELLQGERELVILHGSQIYRLIETRNGKLILQK